MKKAGIAAAAIVACLLFAAYYYYAPRHTPAGQPPVAAVSAATFSSFQKLFNDSAGSARMLVLLSPT